MRKYNYSLKEIIYNVYCLLITKIFYGSSRLIRQPIVIRGKKNIEFGKNLTTGRSCQLEVIGKNYKKKLIFGDNVNIGHNVRIQCAERVIIGSNVLIGSRVTIIDHSHGNYDSISGDSPLIPPNDRGIVSSGITIGKNVWIGDGAIIQKGVSIGEGSIIGANSVVTADVLPGSFMGGIPAKMIKYYDYKSNTWIKNA